MNWSAIKFSSTAAFLLLLAGCGGGGGGGGGSSAAAPPAPTLSLAPQSVKTFHFTWADVSGETEYRLLENPDGASGYTPIAMIAADTTAHDLDVSLPKRINARYILQACNSAGCGDSAPVVVSGTLVDAIGYVKASNTGTSDQFGESVALSGDGNTLAIGAKFESSAAAGVGGNQADNSAVGAGAVYVFVRSGAGIWTQQAYLKASNTGSSDYFGEAVALSGDGNTLAVGALNEASAATGVGGNQADNSTVQAGAVYVFARVSGIWSQEAYVKASNTGSLDYFGEAVALSGDGNTLAVGARGEASIATGIGGNQADNSAAYAGAVYVFTRTYVDPPGLPPPFPVWSQQAYVKASNTNAGDNFGSAVALSGDGNTLAVGANSEASNATGIGGNQADNSAAAAGAVYVFARAGGIWSQEAYVKASNTGSGDFFGRDLVLSSDGNTLAVGAGGEASTATGVGGNQAVNTAANAGAVYVFTRTYVDPPGLPPPFPVWSQQAYVKASNTNAGDAFGRAVALSGDGNTLAVGAYSEASAATGVGGNQASNSAASAGAVYVFARVSGTWSQQAYIKASNSNTDDWFGYVVALSGDGNVLAVSALHESSNAMGIGGNQANNSAVNSGAVYLY